MPRKSSTIKLSISEKEGPLMSGDYNGRDSDSDNQKPGKEWIPDEALESMVMERSLHEGENNVKTSRRLVDENLPIVAQSMIHLAIYSSSERIRFDAGRYLMDRVGEESVTPESTPISEFLQSVLQDVDKL